MTSGSSDRPIALGVGLILVGGFTLIGAVTGTLAAMLAALFDPSILTDAPKSSTNLINIPGLPGYIPGAPTPSGSGGVPVGSPGTEASPTPNEGASPIETPAPNSGATGGAPSTIGTGIPGTDIPIGGLTDIPVPPLFGPVPVPIG